MRAINELTPRALDELRQVARAESDSARLRWEAADADPDSIHPDHPLGLAAYEATGRAAILWRAVYLLGGTIDRDVDRVRWTRPGLTVDDVLDALP